MRGRPGSSPGPADEATTTPTSARLVLGLSLPQVAGSSLAAGTAALAGSFLGVQGTLVGAVVGSVVATVGTAIYAQSLDRAAVQLRAVRTVGQAQQAAGATGGADGGPVAGADEADAQPQPAAPLEGQPGRRSWLRLATAVAVGVVVALAGITAVERIIGHPVSGSTTTGTSIGQAVGGVPRAEPPSTGPSPSATTSRTQAGSATTATSGPTGTASATSATADTATAPTTQSGPGAPAATASTRTRRCITPGAPERHVT